MHKENLRAIRDHIKTLKDPEPGYIQLRWLTNSTRILGMFWHDYRMVFMFGKDWPNDVIQAVRRINYVLRFDEVPDDWSLSRTYGNEHVPIELTESYDNE